MVKLTISSDSMVVDEDKPADRVQLKTPLMDSMEVDESLPVDGVDLKKSSDRSIAQIKEENDVNGDESYKTKLSVHLAAPFEPHRSLQIAPAKNNPSMRIITQYEMVFNVPDIKPQMEWSLIRSRGTISPLHMDSDGLGNLIIVLTGSKYWILMT